MMRLCALIASAALTIAALSGCDRTSSDTPAHVAATSGPLTIEARTPTDTVRTIDRLEATYTAHTTQSGPPPTLDIDRTDTAWAIITDRTDPPRAEHGGITVVRTLVLEPDLDGDFPLPTATAEWTDPSGLTHAASTPPLEITVTSVLSEDDLADAQTAELTEPAGTREPTAAHTGVAPVWLQAALVIGGLVITGVALTYRPPKADPLPPTPRETLIAFVDIPDIIDTRIAAQEIDTALRARLAAPDAPAGSTIPAQTAALVTTNLATPDDAAELKRLADRLDTARFGPTDPRPELIATLARTALEISDRIIAARAARASAETKA